MSLTIPIPQYRCHKTVQALKIEHILRTGLDVYELHFADHRFAPHAVSEDWIKRHSPEPGGYWVLYADRYQSYSPREAFEEGYSLIEDDGDDNAAG